MNRNRLILWALSGMVTIFFCVTCSTNKVTKSSSPQKIVKLTDSEYNILIENARSILLNMPSDQVSQLEKEYIKYRDPKVSLKYIGDKEGVFNIAWEKANSKIFQVMGRGDLTSFQDSFQRVSIVVISVGSNTTPAK